MPRLRVEVNRLDERKVQRFGALRLKPLLQKGGLGQASVFHIRLGPGGRAPATYHRQTHEFFFMLQGSVRGKIDGKSYRFGRGDSCFLPAGSIHEFLAGKSGAQTLAVFFPRLDLGKPDIIAV